MVLAFLAVVAYEVWNTADKHPIEEFMPDTCAYRIVVNDILERRIKLAESQVWESLPFLVDLSWVPQQLETSLEMPQWIANNIMQGSCWMTGNDLSSFDDMVMVTKMSRIGAILDDLYWIMPQFDSVTVDGYRIRELKGEDLFFAVRGRTLVASHSSAALVRVLKYQNERRADQESSIAGLFEAGAEDLRGIVMLGQWQDNPFGTIFDTLSFAIRVEPSEAVLRYRGTLSPQWEQRLSKVLYGMTEQELYAPAEGIARLSANFCKPVRQVWSSVGDILDEPELTESLWNKWETVPEGERPGLPQMLTRLLGPMGPGLCLTWVDVDPNEVIPVPRVIGTFDADYITVPEVFQDFWTLPEGVATWENYPRYDAETQRVFMPMAGGASLEPTAAEIGDKLVLSSSRDLVEDVIARQPVTQQLGVKGNLYFECAPQACAQAAFAVGRPLARLNGIKGYTPESYEELAQQWEQKTEGLQKVAVLAGYEQGQVKGEINITCTPEN